MIYTAFLTRSARIENKNSNLKRIELNNYCVKRIELKNEIS